MIEKLLLVLCGLGFISFITIVLGLFGSGGIIGMALTILHGISYLIAIVFAGLLICAIKERKNK